MLFNSIDFAVFLPIVFLLYWFVVNENLKSQNLLILVASYIFYGWWDWRFLTLILLSTVVDFSVGKGLKRNTKSHQRKLLLWTSIAVNLGILGFFKYYDFFLENFTSAFSLLGTEIKPNTLNIILPIGISFYTFQTLSYSIDVYKRKLEPTDDFIAFSAYVSFFPQLVAGPIERATHLLPQFSLKKTFEYTKAVDGMRQILWGLFKKVIIADNCSEYADLIFNNSADHSGGTLLIGALFFAFQIYGDFSGYSDIAIGTSRLFGFDLMRNFAYPYFSRDMAEFWRRWHISLSTWFRDYVYIPLGGSRGDLWSKIRNTFIIFIVSGLWHGANWTFVIWGALNACYFLPLQLSNKNRNHIEIVAKGRILPSLREIFQITLTFGLTILAWIFFRAESVDIALSMLSEIFSFGIIQVSKELILSFQGLKLISLILVFTVLEWLGREDQFAIQRLADKIPQRLRWAMYVLIIIGLDLIGGGKQEFIYFQF
ncbi:MAG: MBOAT family protein [Roseivirga sp.]